MVKYYIIETDKRFYVVAKDDRWVIYLEGKLNYVIGLQDLEDYEQNRIDSKNNIPGKFIEGIEEFVGKIVRFERIWMDATSPQEEIRNFVWNSKKSMWGLINKKRSQSTSPVSRVRKLTSSELDRNVLSELIKLSGVDGNKYTHQEMFRKAA